MTQQDQSSRFSTITRGLTAVALAALGAAGPAQAVPADYFGLHIHYLGRGTAWPEVPVGSLRTWDAQLTWAELQPQRDRFDFTRLDQYVQTARQKGATVLVPLANTPAWASSRPGEPSRYGPGRLAPPADMQDWRRYVEAVVRRYRGQVQAYEIWNEPSDAGHYTGTLPELVTMACEARRIIRENDPAARVVSPASAGGGRHIAYLASFLSAGGRDCIDIVGHHFYVPRQSPEAMVPLIRQVREVMKQNGIDHLPLWNTETGWWLEDTDGTAVSAMVQSGGGWQKLDGPTGAAWLMRALVLGRAEGLGRFYWYSLDNPYGLGLLQATSRTPKPALAALSQIQSWLGEREVSNCRTVASGVWSCELLDAGRRAVADLLWAESATASMTAVPADLRTRWAGCQPPGESLVPAGRLSSLTLKPAPLLCPRATR
ncbi:MAG: endo-1,4-beta-xylanase [Sphaerotilus natans]